MSLNATIWALRDAPVADAAERVILTLLADNSNHGVAWLAATTAARAAVVDPVTVIPRMRAMEARGLLQRTAPIGRPHVMPTWHVCAPGEPAPVLRQPVVDTAGRASMWPGCWICGGPKEEIDHVKPRARGGAHLGCNLRPICKRCNVAKRARWNGPRWAHELAGAGPAGLDMA